MELGKWNLKSDPLFCLLFPSLIDFSKSITQVQFKWLQHPSEGCCCEQSHGTTHIFKGLLMIDHRYDFLHDLQDYKN